MGERAIHFPHILPHRREHRVPQSSYSPSQEELNKRIREGASRTAIDDQLTIIDLEHQLEDSRHTVSRRGVIAGTLGTVGGLAAATIGGREYYSHQTPPAPENNPNTVISTLNPESLIDPNPLQAVNYLWRVAIPYSEVDQHIDIETSSPGLEQNQALHIDPLAPENNPQIFLGPDRQTYRYVYAIPTDNDGTVFVEIGANDKKTGESPENVGIPFESFVPDIGDRTGTMFFEEAFPSNMDADPLLSDIIRVFTDAEKVLPEGTKVNLWGTSLPFKGQTVVTESRTGIVVSRDQLTQTNASMSEIPYMLGRLIYRKGISVGPNEEIPGDVLEAYKSFNSTVKEFLSPGNITQMGGEIKDGKIVTYPSYLDQLRVSRYDPDFTKSGNFDQAKELEGTNDIFGQMYAIASNEDSFTQFEQWYSSASSMNKIKNAPFWASFALVMNSVQSGLSRPEAMVRVNRFIRDNNLEWYNSGKGDSEVSPE